MIRHTTACLGIPGLLLLTTCACAQVTVARWVDAEGVTHFSSLQFAPPGADLEVVDSVNGMTAPDTGAAGSSAGGPAWSLISRPPKQNPRGWRTKGDGVNRGPVQRTAPQRR
ncbi:MAG TPA: DUF4124 domain-containing protein [Pseudomonadales bacterium]